MKARFEYIETLLESLADRHAESEARLSRSEAHLSRLEAEFQKRFNATLKIVQTGMRMLVRIEDKMAELAESQKRTDRNLQLFIDSLKKGRNGRNDRPKN